MLLFIEVETYFIDVPGTFQYISCYSLSHRTVKYLHLRQGFNTSHVTLYPSLGRHLFWRIAFQYISCYSLSWAGHNLCNSRESVSIHLMLLFIWWTWPTRNWITVSIHLMLLFIWWKQNDVSVWRNVSIHLMLLFIRERDGG